MHWPGLQFTCAWVSLVTGLHFEGFAPERPQLEIWGRYLQANHTPDERSAGRDQIKGRPNNKFLLKQIVLDLTGRSSGFEPGVGLSITTPPSTSDCFQEVAGKQMYRMTSCKNELSRPLKRMLRGKLCLDTNLINYVTHTVIYSYL